MKKDQIKRNMPDLGMTYDHENERTVVSMSDKYIESQTYTGKELEAWMIGAMSQNEVKEILQKRICEAQKVMDFAYDFIRANKRRVEDYYLDEAIEFQEMYRAYRKKWIN